ncbi:rhodanese-like domain-containing protein [Lentzea sp. NPDC092896]|uniref:rhodanese-like domain-containing protein n=1 Tax=Lentzea sp. NPDC092896 TaxID=3364127 RepID=UPI00381E3469
MTRYVIIGGGAVGATAAAELHEAGRQVILVARGSHLDALRTGGLRYVRPGGVSEIRLAVVGGPDEVELQQDDVLVVATKSQDTEEVVRAWAWRPVGTSTAAAALPIVLLQNGLENERIALRRFATVFGAVVWIPASHLSPGEVVSPAEPAAGAFWLGAYPSGTHPRLAEIAEDLADARFHTEIVDDIQRWKAAKLIGNTGNALDALYRPSALRSAALRLTRQEAALVLGAPALVPDRIREVVVIRPIPGHDRSGSSTWQSLQRGGAPETDYLNGEVSLQARLSGQTAPYNAALAERVQRAVAEGVEPGSLDDADLAATLPGLTRRAVLTEPAELHRLLQNGQAPVLLDVRWALGDTKGHDHYRAGHIPSAVYVDLDTQLANHDAPATAGRHPLPDIADLQEAARSWGVTEHRPVVVYDDNGGTSAARAWWLLRWAGLSDVRILDGAWKAWQAEGFEIAVGDETAEPGDVELSAGNLPTLTADEAAVLADKGVLLDARAAERYRGEVEPIDPRAGHIPGARSAPTAANLKDGAFLSTEELRAKYADLDGADVGVYCGSGVTAAHEIAALAIAGVDAALFPGSWSAWSSDPERPVATGPE